MISFIVLHYLVEKETQKCVDSILKLKCEKKIIIVDNCSPNDSLKKLKEYYKNNSNVIIIKNKENNGFAKGNNLGYLYAKQNIKDLKFIVVMNNDMEILQSDFIQKINLIYNKEKFYLLGPDIFSTSAKIHQNPENKNTMTIEKIDEKLKKLKSISDNEIKFKSYLKKIPFLDSLVKKYRQTKVDKNNYKTKAYNKMLHASCIIYSSLYIEREDIAFLPITDFYCEDLILNYYCNKNNYLMVYSPEIVVYHHEDISTDATFDTYIKKVSFKNKCMIQSLESFKEYMQQNEKK